MKQLTMLALAMIVLSSISHGQKTKDNKTATNASAASATIEEHHQKHVLYKGYSNKLRISVDGYRNTDISVSCAGCALQKAEDGSFIATVPLTGKGLATITVLANNKTVRSQEFQIKDFPAPDILLSEIPSGFLLSLKQIQQKPSLSLEWEVAGTFKIDAFEIQIGSKSIMVSGSELLEEHIQFLSENWAPGEVLIIQKVKYSNNLFDSNRAVAATFRME